MKAFAVLDVLFKRARANSWSAGWLTYALTAVLVGAATVVGLPLRGWINPTNLVMPYLVAVVLVAVWLGRYPAIFASLLSVLVFDLVFVPPYHMLAVADVEYLLTFAGLLGVSMVISELAVRAREQERAARTREAQTAALYDLSRKLAALGELQAVGQAAVDHVHTALDAEAALFTPPTPGSPVVLVSQTSGFELDAESFVNVRRVCREGEEVGRYGPLPEPSAGSYLPLRTGNDVVGVLAVQPTPQLRRLPPESRRLLEGFASQIALALERAQLAEQARHARLLEETEKLQTALLNSISHDLRTPLASITGVLSSLHDDGHLLDDAARQELTDTAWEEARRLNRLVGNLLNMTRLEAGALKVVRRPVDIQDLVGAALAQMPHRLEGREVSVQVPHDLGPAPLDFVLMVQVVVNLVDNALKYSPSDAPLRISAECRGNEIILTVADRGRGIPPTAQQRLFDKFFRVNEPGVEGTGLGLSISKGIVDAHHGRIWAENRPGGGARLHVALPLNEKVEE
ncbi:MAG: DUF4118 domain-containing protein [Candidatus Promineifilaceae bacterium]|nr:DUF4118 domain-containing protein [Candidatus Promineifilaceae bacterium]